MSNIIKRNYILYNKSDKVLIDTSEKPGSFGPISLVKVIQEEEENAGDDTEPIFLSGEGDEGEREELSQEENKIFIHQMEEEARMKALEIIEAAKKEADEIRKAADNEGRQEGYQKGMQEANEEFEKKKGELEQLKAEHEDEYAARMEELEPQFADLTLKLVEKMTGMIAEDKRDLILYQISRAIKPIRGPKQFIIRVSKEDASVVIQKKEELLTLLAPGCSLEVIEDGSLEKNQCFIETEDRLLDVSLDVELKNLADHFRILACSE